MALKQAYFDPNPSSGSGIHKWGSQADRKFYKSKEVEPVKTHSEPIIAPTDEMVFRPGTPVRSEKSLMWSRAFEHTNTVIKSLSDTFYSGDLEFPALRSLVIDKLEKGLSIPEDYHNIVTTELAKSNTVNDLKYKLGLIAKSFAYARV